MSMGIGETESGYRKPLPSYVTPQPLSPPALCILPWFHLTSETKLVARHSQRSIVTTTVRIKLGTVNKLNAQCILGFKLCTHLLLCSN